MRRMTYTTAEEIRHVIEQTKATLGYTGHIAWRFNGRCTHRMGQATWMPGVGVGHVEFSTPLWPKATPAQRYETIVHEVCHVVAGVLYRSRGHGPAWRNAMRRCGLTPKRCHNVDTPAKRRRAGGSVWVCNCPGQEHYLGPLRTRKLMDGAAAYTCRRCRARLRARQIA